MSREMNIHCARVYLREARERAKIPAQRGYCFVLLQWAADCRKRALHITPMPQGELF